MSKYLLPEKELEDAIQEGNPYAKKVGSKEEKVYTDILYNLKQTQDRLAEKIYDSITEYQGLIEECSKIEHEIYEISGEWGLNYFYDQNKMPNISKLAEACDI